MTETAFASQPCLALSEKHLCPYWGILSIQWCALSPFICAIFRGSAEWSDERGATKASPSREANHRQLWLFFLHPGFVFFSFNFQSFCGYFRVPENSTFLHQSILFTVWNDFIMLLMWVLRNAVSLCQQDTQSTTTVLLNPVWFKI